jgi:hypothetical protein
VRPLKAPAAFRRGRSTICRRHGDTKLFRHAGDSQSATRSQIKPRIVRRSFKFSGFVNAVAQI